MMKITLPTSHLEVVLITKENPEKLDFPLRTGLNRVGSDRKLNDIRLDSISKESVILLISKTGKTFLIALDETVFINSKRIEPFEPIEIQVNNFFSLGDYQCNLKSYNSQNSDVQNFNLPTATLPLENLEESTSPTLSFAAVSKQSTMPLVENEGMNGTVPIIDETLPVPCQDFGTPHTEITATIPLGRPATELQQTLTVVIEEDLRPSEKLKRTGYETNLQIFSTEATIPINLVDEDEEKRMFQKNNSSTYRFSDMQTVPIEETDEELENEEIESDSKVAQTVAIEGDQEEEQNQPLLQTLPVDEMVVKKHDHKHDSEMQTLPIQDNEDEKSNTDFDENATMASEHGIETEKSDLVVVNEAKCPPNDIFVETDPDNDSLASADLLIDHTSSQFKPHSENLLEEEKHSHYSENKSPDKALDILDEFRNPPSIIQHTPKKKSRIVLTQDLEGDELSQTSQREITKQVSDQFLVTAEDIQNMEEQELLSRLKAIGLNTSGSISQLKERLLFHCRVANFGIQKPSSFTTFKPEEANDTKTPSAKPDTFSTIILEPLKSILPSPVNYSLLEKLHNEGFAGSSIVHEAVSITSGKPPKDNVVKRLKETLEIPRSDEKTLNVSPEPNPHFRKMKVSELQKELINLGLDTNGTKNALIDRLENYFKPEIPSDLSSQRTVEAAVLLRSIKSYSTSSPCSEERENNDLKEIIRDKKRSLDDDLKVFSMEANSREENAGAQSSSSRKGERRHRESVHIMFTNLEPTELHKKYIKQFGGDITDHFENVTHLVCLKGSLKRTLKLLRVMAIPGCNSPRIVHSDWLSASASKGIAVDPYDFCPFEGDISLRDALKLRDRDITKGILFGLTVLVAEKDVQPPYEDLMPIVKAAGGDLKLVSIESVNAANPKSTVVIGSETAFSTEVLTLIVKKKFSLCKSSWISQSIASYSLKTCCEHIIRRGSFFV